MSCYVLGCRATETVKISHPRFGLVDSCIDHDPSRFVLGHQPIHSTGQRLDPNLALYVYCFIESGKPLNFGQIGLPLDADSPEDEIAAASADSETLIRIPSDKNGRSDVFMICHKNLAAVVSEVFLHSPSLPASPRNVIAHERVNEFVMREHAVIPMTFGTIFKTKDDIMQLLSTAEEEFSDVLAKMENKVEWGLKVLLDENNDKWRKSQTLEEIRKEMESKIGTMLRPVAVNARYNETIGEKMIVNAAFLVSRDQQGDFDARIKLIASRFPYLMFKYTGPWPPYNFVNLRLETS
jgi:hypothetical protein